MKAVVAAFNQERPLVGAFSVITNLRLKLYRCGPAVIYLAVAAIKLSTPCVWILRQPGLSRPGPVTVHRIWIHLEPPLRAGEDKFRTIGDLLE